jgi:predicted TIM-barrel fold metal-dependent hydrolase
MIIDSHCHLKHGNKERTEYTPESIVQAMDEANIDKTVVFAMATSTSQANEMAHKAHQAFPDRLIPYAYALPHITESAYHQVEHAISALGFPGIKIHAGEVNLKEYIIDPIFELAAKHDVPCLIDFKGRTEDCQRIAETFPKTKIIVAHFGIYLCTNSNLIDSFITLAEKHENLTLDTSGVVLPWKIPEAIQRIGSDRITFGIDGPHPYPTQATYAKNEINRIQILPITEQDKQNLFYNTIARLLKLD